MDLLGNKILSLSVKQLFIRFLVTRSNPGPSDCEAWNTWSLILMFFFPH